MKALAAVALVMSAIALTGCGSDRDGSNDKGWRSENIATPDGSVTCILFDGYDSDAISCNWKDAK